ncbi:ABC transporter ATP-binding protein [Methylocella sp.]|uniref:ABC transporter ATP-binding protein n=1 Tax=Methylocella sp. TaxID=1978226 RepID=UPI003783DEF7
MTDCVLKARGLEAGYGAGLVVKGIDLEVRRGEIVCLIGANGAGKTTTLRALSGLMKPRAGELRLDGRDVAGRRAHEMTALGMAHAPEGRQVFGDMSVAENLLAGAYLAPGRAETERRRKAALALFPRLEERLAQRAGLLSGGEQQMLAIARALMSAPKLLLLDEPSMGLAPLMVQEIFSILARLRAEGAAILLVEQNAHAALALSDRAYVLELGRVVLEGAGAELLRHDAVSAAYLGRGG